MTTLTQILSAALFTITLMSPFWLAAGLYYAWKWATEDRESD